jgi:hydroxycarboxylate dehydrogenase B
VPRLDHGRLLTATAAILEGAGATRDHAAVVAEHLVGSNLVGHDSHGVMRLSQYCEAIETGELDPRARPSVRKESVAGAVLDGQRSFGQVAAAEGMSLAMERARLVGVSAVTLRNCYHSGRLAVYSLMASRAGMIGIVMVNAGGGGQSVAPFGGIARRLATNPFAIAVPSGGEFDPVLDIATSMAPEGKIRDYHRRGELVPEGWIVDADGVPSRDTRDFYGPPAGALLPWGGPVGYKGFGLALMIDVIAGALSGAGCCSPQEVPARDGVLLLAIDVEQFTDGDLFRRQVIQLIQHVKSCPAAPGIEEVFVPGELEHRESQKRRRTGILVDDATWNEMHSLAQRYGLPARIFNGPPGEAVASYAAAPVSGEDLAAS